MISILRSRKDILGFDDRKLFLRGVPIIGVLINLLFFGHLLLENRYFMFGFCLVIGFIYSAIYWLSFREIHYHYVIKYPDFKDNRRRILSTVVGVFLSFFIIFHICKWVLSLVIKYGMYTLEVPHPVIEVISSAMFIVLVLTIYEALYSGNRLRKALIQQESLEKANISSQLMALRTQINPHFLFNSLNTLTSLIHKDVDRAENFAIKLSKVYRYMLEHRDDTLTTLDDEMVWLHSYIHLLKERFGDNLIVKQLIDSSLLDKYILPLCLQITFENAIKHNIITNDKPLVVTLDADDHYLTITNNLQKKDTVSSSTKFGLQNIAKRYEFFTDKLVLVNETEAEFKVSLPLLTPSNLKNEIT